MIILLTNDDGYDAPGLAAAYDAVHDLGNVHVVAPKTERSGCGHAITLRRPITVERFKHERFGIVHAVGGSPADCVRLGVTALVDAPVDLIVAGINRGANAGVDVFYSGTIAAGREGAILGIRSICASQAVRAGVELDWPAASEVAAGIIRNLAGESLPGPGFWSVNLPAPIPPQPQKHIQRVPVATEPQPMVFERGSGNDGRAMEFEYRASYWVREETEPSDYTVIREGGIAISAIPLHGRF